MPQSSDRYWIGRMYRRVKPQDIAPEPGRAPDAWRGYCHTCHDVRYESQCHQVIRDECCLYACRVCESTIDEQYTPF